MKDYRIFRQYLEQQGEKGSIALEYVLITVFATLLSVALLAGASSFIREKASALEQSQGISIDIPDISFF